MKERPILFSAPMVRAIMSGSKIQTRRVVKPQPSAGWAFEVPPVLGRITSPHPKRDQFGAFIRRGVGGDFPETDIITCPYGQPGDRLWVRETFFAWGRWETRYSANKGRDEWHFVDLTLEAGKAYQYPASGGQPQPMEGKRDGGVTPKWWKRPAIHMPRAASRIMLEITGVRVERLQGISPSDAQAEGIFFTDYGRKCGHKGRGWTDVGDCPAPVDHHPQRPGWAWQPTTSHEQCLCTPVNAFGNLWEHVNGQGTWYANPWVWVVEFRRLP